MPVPHSGMPSKTTLSTPPALIGFAARQGGVGDDTFIAMNADVLAEIDVTALVEFHRSRGAQATIALTPVQDPSLFGVVAVDATGKVESFIEKPGRRIRP